MVKQTYRKMLYRRTEDLVDAEDHKRFILDVLEDVKARIDIPTILNANERYIQQLISQD